MKAAEQGGESERAATISRLYREHNRVLVGFLYARLKSEPEAKEVAQEAYVKILQLDDPNSANFLRAYLFRVAENLAFDRLRQRRARSRLDQLNCRDDFLAEVSAERVAIAGEELTLLERAVNELPPKCKEAFRLHKFEDCSFSEAASSMGISERMVRKHVARALVYVRLRRDGMSAEDACGQLSLS